MFFAVLAIVGCASAQTMKKVATTDLPGPAGQRFDYLTMDDEDHFLMMQKMKADSLADLVSMATKRTSHANWALRIHVRADHAVCALTRIISLFDLQSAWLLVPRAQLLTLSFQTTLAFV